MLKTEFDQASRKNIPFVSSHILYNVQKVFWLSHSIFFKKSMAYLARVANYIT